MKVVRLAFFANICGNVYSRPFPDQNTKDGDTITCLESETPDKYLLKGGLSKIQYKLKQIKNNIAKDEEMIICASGNLIAGSPESLFSQGQLVVSTLNKLNINYTVPGNLDFIYGQRIFDYTFNQGRDNNNYCHRENNYKVPSWINTEEKKEYLNSTSIALNIFQLHDQSDKRISVLPSYKIHTINEGKDKIDIGIIGLSIKNRPIYQGHHLGVIGDPYNYYIDGETNNSKINQRCIDDLLITTVRYLKYRLKCHAIILISDFGYKSNIRLAEMEQLIETPINVILSSNSQGNTVNSSTITNNNKTLVVETGIYGESLSTVKLSFSIAKKNKLVSISHKNHLIGPYSKDDQELYKHISNLMNKYYPDNKQLIYPDMHLLSTNNKLQMKINRNLIFPLKGISSNNGGIIIRKLNNGLHRMNTDKHPFMSSQWEGSTSNWICNSIQKYCDSDIAFLYSNICNMNISSYNNLSSHEKYIYGYGNGNLTLADVFNAYPMTSYVGYGYMSGTKIISIIKKNIYMVFHRNIYVRLNEYLHVWSNINIVIQKDSFDKLRNGKYQNIDNINLMIFIWSKEESDYVPIDKNKLYKVAGEINPDMPNKINGLVLDYPTNISGADNNAIYALSSNNNNNNNKHSKTENNSLDTNYISIPECVYKYNMSITIKDRSKMVNDLFHTHNRIYSIEQY